MDSDHLTPNFGEENRIAFSGYIHPNIQRYRL